MIEFVKNDSEEVLNNLVSVFENALGESLQPSDERKLFLHQLASVVVLINSSINDTGNQLLLRTARGEALDEIGDLFGVYRLPASSATCTLKFTLSAIQTSPVTIPKGTRATPDGKVYFATVNDLVINAGETTGTVAAKAITAGTQGNGFAEKTVKYIVDNVEYLSSVENTDKTSGGQDEESDDSLRARIRLVPESYSTAGCAEGYEYFAKSASASVGDVIVYSPVNDATLSEDERKAGAGKVFIYVVKHDGTIPEASDAILAQVAETASARNRRPLTDFVTVLPPEKVDFSINFTYYISEENASNATNIARAVEAAVEEYISWQSIKIGRDINPDKLRKLILDAGASRVNLTSPTYTEIKKYQVAKLKETPSITYAGLSE